MPFDSSVTPSPLRVLRDFDLLAGDLLGGFPAWRVVAPWRSLYFAWALHDLPEYAFARRGVFRHQQRQFAAGIFRDVEVAGLQILDDVQRIAEMGEAVDTGDRFGDVAAAIGIAGPG